jgi:hypothetical protein
MEEQIKQSNPTLHKYLFTVTTFSKLLAMILFITLPFAGFYLGMKYQEKTNIVTPYVLQTQKIVTPTTTPDSFTNLQAPPDISIIVDDISRTHHLELTSVSVSGVYGNFATGSAVQVSNGEKIKFYASYFEGNGGSPYWNTIWQGIGLPKCLDLMTTKPPKELICIK